jgi:hypothetical protein
MLSDSRSQLVTEFEQRLTDTDNKTFVIRALLPIRRRLLVSNERMQWLSELKIDEFEVFEYHWKFPRQEKFSYAGFQ